MTALIAHSLLHLIVFYAVFIVSFAPEFIGKFFQNPEKGAVGRDRGSYWVIMFSVGGGIFLAFWFAFNVPATTIAGHQPVLFWIGIALMLVGMAFRWYAIRVLGRFFTRSVATRAGQYVVDTGPYRLIRHPSYSGAMLAMIGLGLAMTNWASIALIVSGMLIGYSYRVRVEERALCEGIGPAYREYMRHTRRFIPHVW
ncbi:MAG: methyltransferase family protein [Rhodanobacteraceae bacterium]